MWSFMLLLAFSLFLQVAAAAAQPVVVRTFEDDKVGAPPAGFVAAVGREGAADQWIVQREGKGRVLAHQGKSSPPDAFAVAIFTGAQYQDVEITVRLKATGGSRSAGLVWRYQDPLNHYAAQLDLAKQELAVYRVSGGNRIRIEHEDDLELDPEAWHSLRVVHEDGEIRVYLGGIRVFGERDRRSRGPAGVGLWSSGDTTVMFDDFRIEDETEVPVRSGQTPSTKQ
ncbi:MAG TPA: family 16 glycoside hydrolase [Vicinamibacterales bacterium]|nr:family 16 glycoside hydrolase [Vicinamibacterales bacterium]